MVHFLGRPTQFVQLAAALPLAGSLYIVTGLARRLTTAGLRWSAGYPARRTLLALAGLACAVGLASLWTLQGQFRGWYPPPERRQKAATPRGWRDGYLGWKRIPPSNRMTSAFM